MDAMSAIGGSQVIGAEALMERTRGRSPQEARRAAEDLVSIALVQPILAQLRESNDSAPPFAPGAGEKLFGPMLDAAMASKIVQGQNFGVVDAVARKLADPGRDMVMWSKARSGVPAGGGR